MKLVPKPNRSTPLMQEDGKTVSDAWDEYFKYLENLHLQPISAVAPTNGQVLIWNDTTKLYVPGAN